MKTVALLGSILIVTTACNQFTGGGPIDGIYAVNAVTCQGRSAAGNIATPTLPNTTTYTITNLTGFIDVSQGTCAVQTTIAITYPAAGTLTVTPVANACFPATCSPVCAAPVDTTTLTYTYDPTQYCHDCLLNLKGNVGDQTCQKATPAQTDPVTIQLYRRI